MTNKIEWRDIPDYEGFYQVSSDGRVLSLERTCQGHRIRRVSKRELKQTEHTQDGKVWSVTVTIAKEGRDRKTCSVGRLILLAFVGPPSDKQVAHFKDGNPGNPQLNNLEWSTVGAITTQQHRRKHEEYKRKTEAQ